MEFKKVTYGAPGLMEWVAIIAAGATTLRVPFTGGSITAYGVTPAQYTTANPIYQAIIENSQQFKAGKIVKLKEYAMDGQSPVQIIRNTKATAAKVESEETSDGINNKTTNVETTKTAATTESEGETSDGIVDETSAEEDVNMIVVDVTDVDDAANYLKENFGVAKKNVRSKEAAEQVGIANNITFNWV
jgi:hypothetical protein